MLFTYEKITPRNWAKRNHFDIQQNFTNPHSLSFGSKVCGFTKHSAKNNQLRSDNTVTSFKTNQQSRITDNKSFATAVKQAAFSGPPPLLFNCLFTKGLMFHLFREIRCSLNPTHVVGILVLSSLTDWSPAH